MKRLFAFALLVASVSFAFALALGGCDDSCVDTGCIAIDAGPDVKAEGGKKDAGKDAASEAATDAASDGETDASSDAAEEAGDASDATTD
jgi:hypothetical protein